jgi:hypothetical protein
MTLQEAVSSLKPFKRKDSLEVAQWYLGGTGPFKDLVECDYFVCEGQFSTGIDLYASDIFADDWILVGEE